MKSVIAGSEGFEAHLRALVQTPDFLTNELFRIPGVRDALTRDRYENMFGAAIARSASDLSSKVTIEHNTDVERMFFDDLSRRPDLIAQPLSCLNRVRQNAGRMKVLSIGARTEAELFSLVNAGFHIDNITCVDLFSYSPHIRIGDVNQLGFADDAFDVVVCGWVLEFCNDIPRACGEILRVAKPGGYVCIGGMHHPVSSDMAAYNRLKLHDDRVWFCSIDAIRTAFGVSEGAFVFKSDIDEQDLDKRGEVVAIFQAEKAGV